MSGPPGSDDVPAGDGSPRNRGSNPAADRILPPRETCRGSNPAADRILPRIESCRGSNPAADRVLPRIESCRGENPAADRIRQGYDPDGRGAVDGTIGARPIRGKDLRLSADHRHRGPPATPHQGRHPKELNRGVLARGGRCWRATGRPTTWGSWSTGGAPPCSKPPSPTGPPPPSTPATSACIDSES